jgi:hypothetical protein
MTRKRLLNARRVASREPPGFPCDSADQAPIVEYKGRKLTTEQANKLEARGNRYLFEINSRWTIEGTSRWEH